MNKKLLSIVGVIAIVAALAMYLIGKDSSHLSELEDIWWTPLPIALICFLAASRKRA